jgi:four helix bundle protein
LRTPTLRHLKSLAISKLPSGIAPAAGVGVKEKAAELRRRTAAFSVSVLKCVRRASRDPASEVVLRQLARSASSAAANYRAACAGRSRPEFIAKLGIAVEEADETVHWLSIASELQIGAEPELSPLHAEARELRAILWASLRTARRNWSQARGR